MANYLDFKPASCKDCYKCLRSCPVKAIAVTNHQAKIIEDRCILCGTCTHVCPQNAKRVHSDKGSVLELLASGAKVVASVAPSFVSTFGVLDFSVMKLALCKLGFADAEETAVGANLVTKEYEKLLKTKTYKNFITSACPAVNSLIQMYYPKALSYLAAVDSPMIAHAKLLLHRDNTTKVVFIGPCIAKKKEAAESGIIAASLTFEDLTELFADKGIDLNEISRLPIDKPNREINQAKYYPISGGIIKSFKSLPSDYEYVSIDGAQKCMDILESIDSLSGMFLELNACDYACVNGPCSLMKNKTAIKANSDIRQYVVNDLIHLLTADKCVTPEINISTVYPRIKTKNLPVTDREIKEILAKTGKTKPEDELNCGACGYSSCREKAWAVANGFAELDMCLPYMRERAETMAFEILQNSPNGIIVLDNDLKIVEINNKARAILGIDFSDVKGSYFVDYANPTDFLLAAEGKTSVYRKKVYVSKTKVHIELTIIVQKEQRMLFGFMTDITEETDYDEKLEKVRNDTITATDELIMKQMRVAQEIASLLGESTAETKVALHNLKKALSESNKGDE